MSDEAIKALEGYSVSSPNAPSQEAIDALMQLQRQKEGNPMALLQGQKELGDPGLENPAARFSLSIADTISEKGKAFAKHYPNGDLKEDPVDGTLLFRPDKATPYAKVDAGLTEKFEPLGDIIDLLSGDIGAIGGEALMLIRSKGASLLSKAVRAYVGGGGGEIVQEYTEGYLGAPQEESFDQIAGRAQTKGLFGAGGAVAGVGLSKAVEGFRGGGFASTIAGTPQAQRASEYLGSPPPILSEVANSPIVRRWGSQAATLTSRLGNYVEAQSTAVVRAVSGLRENQYLPYISNKLAALHTKAKKDILSVARVHMTSAEEAGENFLRGIIEYETRARGIVDAAYKKAREIETPEFDLAPVDDAIRRLGRGQPAPGMEGAVQTAEELGPEIQGIMNVLRNIDPAAKSIVIDGEEFTVTDGLLRLRERLWDAKTPNPGELFRREHSNANTLYTALTRVLDNPKNANPNFVSAWKTARAHAAERFDNWEVLTDIGIAKRAARENVLQDGLVRQLVQPHKASSLRFLRENINNSKFGSVQNFFKSDLLRNPNEITKKLIDYDKETLDLLLTPGEQKLFQNIGREMDRLNNIGLDRILAKQHSYQGIIEDALLRKDTAAIDDLYKLVSLQPGGLKSESGQALRAGLLDVIYKRVTDIPQEELTRKVIFSRVKSTLEELRGTGALRFLTARDLRTLRSAQIVESITRAGKDAGTSIHAMEATSGARRLEAQAIQTIVEQMGVGWLLTRPWYTKFVISRGKPKKPHTVLEGLSQALSTIAAPEE